MDLKEHLKKVARLEGTMRKLESSADGETIIENCMLAGTHLVNAALHQAGMGEADIIHSDLLAIDRKKGLAIPTVFKFTRPELKVAVEALAKIESVRPEFIRGDRDCTAALAEEILREYNVLKTNCLAIVGRSEVS